MRKYTNKHNIPLPLAVWLAFDSYDYVDDPNYLSATTVMKPIRPMVLMQRHEPRVQDVTELVASRMGTAIHDSLEKVWSDIDRVSRVLESLGFPASVAKRIKINPDPTTVTDADIPIYMEQRRIKEFMGKKIGGKFDFVGEFILHDFKSTSPYSYMDESKAVDYKIQGSIYRWLFPDLIKTDFIRILFIFTGWKAHEYAAQKEKGYPPHKVWYKDVPLMSIEETEEYLKNKIEQYNRFAKLPENKLPKCNKDDLWQGDTKYKYFGKAENTRASKTFDDPVSAKKWLAEKGKGEIREEPGMVKACAYCPAQDHCSQRKLLIEQGLFVPSDE